MPRPRGRLRSTKAQPLVDKYHSLWETKQQRGTWLRIDVVVLDMETKRFRLQCASCHDHVQLNNPSGFYQTHLKKRSAPAIEVPSSFARYSAWKKISTGLEAVTKVAMRLLSGHATSASAERNWSLWGRVYIAARSSLGEERAKQLIAICAAEQVENYVPNDIAMILDILESSGVVSQPDTTTVEVSE
jgi:hypothetical protein